MASIFAKFFGRTVSEAAAYAAGVATAPTLHPIVRELENETWALYPNVPLPASVAAALEAQGNPQGLNTAAEASFTGVNETRLGVLKFLAQRAPTEAIALELWRRGRITEAQARAALEKSGLLPEYVDPVLELFTDRLDPAVIATAIQRGIMHDPGFLPVGPPTATGRVPAFPVSSLDALLEAQANGIDRDRLFVETAIVGLPLSLQQAASAYFRGIIELADFERAVAEGNTRNEWGASALEQARQILTAAQYAEAELRGVITTAQRHADTAKHGMSVEDSDVLFDVIGRGLAVHAMTTGLARGGTFGGTYADVPEPYRSALRRSNIRPEYAKLSYANRYSYPSAFVVRALLTDGALTEAEGEQIFLNIGYPPALAHTVAAHYAGTTTAVADPHVKKAETQLWSQAHRSYIAEEIDAATVTPALAAAGVAAGAVPEVLALWDAERALIRKQLTPAQIRKAVKAQVLNPATGVAWTLQDALAALLARGYSQADATTFMEEI